MGDPLTTEDGGLIGSRELFAERFALLYAEAGDPPLKRVTESVARARRLDERGQLVRIPAQRVSDWRRGRNVPARFAALAVVLEILIGEARKIRPRAVTPGLYDLWAWRELWERALASPTADAEPSADASVCPYLGLAAFGPAEARWFFGRERATGALVERVDGALRTGGIVMLVGASGAGKSSLLHAGLIPALAGGELDGVLDWPVVATTPGPDPVKELARQIPGLENCHEVSGADLDALVRKAAGRLVVVVDQFEEIFTLCEDESQRRLFVQVLQAICAPPEPGVVVLGLRADFYGRCLDYPELVLALQDRQLVLGPMLAAELREAVIRPSKAVGLRLEDGLVELLLNDLGAGGERGRGAHDAGALPLLSHALLATWQRRQAGRLTVAGYRAAGGIHGAVAATAEEAWTRLGRSGQAVAQPMLLGLVRVGEDGQDSRRRSTREDLLARTTDPAVAEEVLELLAAARLITLDAASVEITHEALLRAWPRLGGWIDRDRAGMLARQRLEEDALVWDTEGRDTSLLYRGARLEAGQQSAADPGEVSPVAREFLAVSTRYRRRAAWIRRAVVAVIAVFALIAATTAVIAVRQRDDARFGQVLAEADRLQETDPSLAAQLYLVAHQLRPNDKDVYTRLLSTQHSPLATPLVGHTGAIYLTSFSPNGRMLATASYDKTVRLWDVHDRSHPAAIGQPLTGHTSWVSSAVFSPDGQVLATAGDDHTIRLWDVADPSHPAPIGAPLTGNNGTIYLIAFSPDGGTLATANEDHTARLWDVHDPAHTVPIGQPLTGAQGPVRAIAFSPNNKLLAVSGDDHTIRLWNVADPTRPAPVGQPLTGPDNTVHSVAFSTDGRTLACGSEDKTVRLWDVADPSTAHSLGPPLIGHAGGIWSVAFRPDGRALASASSDGTARLWNVTNPAHATQLGQPLAGHGSGLFALGFSPDGATLATGSGDSTVRLWSIPPTVLIGHTGDARWPTFSRDGRLLATGSGDGTARLWNVADPANPTPIEPAITGHTSYVDAVSIGPDGQLLATAGGDRTVRLWNIADPAHPVPLGAPLPLNTRYSALAALGPDRRTLVTGADDLSVRLWDVTNPSNPLPLGQPLLGHTGYTNRAAFSPDGRVLATASSDKTIRLWSLLDRAHPTPLGAPLLGHTSEVLMLAFSADSRLLATTGVDKTIRLWDVRDPTKPKPLGQPLTGHRETVHSAEFSPDGHLLVSGSEDGTIRLWDISDPANATPLGQPITPHVAASLQASFSPDGNFIATASTDAVVRLWDLDIDHVIHRICAATQGILTSQQWQQHLSQLSYEPPCGR
jgi:WD40 repeat protein